MRVTTNMVLCLSTIVIAVNAFAESSGSLVSTENRALMDQLKTCSETAIQQGATSVPEITTVCQQDVDSLEAEMPNLADILIQQVLN